MKHRSERGEVVVEASIVVTLVMIVLTIMLYVGMIMYQQTLISVMANQTAANIAQIYSNNLKDPFSGYVDPDQVYQSVTYSSMKTDAYMSVIEQKANIFGQYRLKSSRILANGNTSVEVEVVKKPNELLKSQVVVTIHDRYDVPLVGLFDVDGLVEFSSSGRADCVDILEYINGVEAVGNPENSNVGYLPDAKNCTVTFIADRDNPSDIKVETVLKGKTIMSSNRYTHCVMPANPKKGDLEFAGWYDESGRAFTASTQVDQSLTVYGMWKCTVTLNANGGSVNGKATHTMKVTYGNRAALPNGQRSGYHFDGWYDGSGKRYIANDTPIMGNVTLTATWRCAHPQRYESGRNGSPCTGGTIYYKCSVCHADVGTGTYGGTGHNFTRRCNTLHYCSSFSGTGSGGCGGYHRKNQYCSTCKVTHSTVRYYHPVCLYCNAKGGWWWCANDHCWGAVHSRGVGPCS